MGYSIYSDAKAAKAKKSRIGNLPKILDVKDYSSIENVLKNNGKNLAEKNK